MGRRKKYFNKSSRVKNGRRLQNEYYERNKEGIREKNLRRYYENKERDKGNMGGIIGNSINNIDNGGVSLDDVIIDNSTDITNSTDIDVGIKDIGNNNNNNNIDNNLSGSGSVGKI